MRNVWVLTINFGVVLLLSRYTTASDGNPDSDGHEVDKLKLAESDVGNDSATTVSNNTSNLYYVPPNTSKQNTSKDCALKDTNSTSGNNTCNHDLDDMSIADPGFHDDKSDWNMEMYKRAFYVVIAVSAVVVIYLGVKTYLVRRRKGKIRRYNVMEERRLDMSHISDEEEDNLFDQSKKRLISS